MPTTKSWLESLTIAKLQRLAITIGAPCSGTKAARVEGIRRAVANVENYHDGSSAPLSLLSIDMGIRNLSFSHLTAPLRRVPKSPGYLQYEKPTLQVWRRLAVSEPIDTPDAVTSRVRSDPSKDVLSESVIATPSKAPRETFEPVDYAKHAYDLIYYMVQTYRPTHVLIERQRFRSGGGSAVQEWTIRVGVFEGMLYSVLRTLTEERRLQLSVEPMQPPRVNRYWLESPLHLSAREPKKLAGREVKKAKIELVGSILSEADATVRVDGQLHTFATDFVSSWRKATKRQRGAIAGMSKLDDLADSLLQGLAWIEQVLPHSSATTPRLVLTE